MNKLISGWLWAYRGIEEGKKTLSSLRKYYPCADLIINVDKDGDIDGYKKVADDLKAHLVVNPIQLGYCGNFGNVDVGRTHWPKTHTITWLDQLYLGCGMTDSKYMIMLEEDDYILNNISVLDRDFSMAIHPVAPSPTGRMRPQPIPAAFREFAKSHKWNGHYNGYGAGGGVIFNRIDFIESWELIRESLWENYEYLEQQSSVIGWVDFILQFVMMCGGHEIIQNDKLCEHWEVPNFYSFDIITGLKDHTLIKL